jgi:hypothetical protein
MLLELVFLLAGICVGLAIRNEQYQKRQSEIYDSLDEKLRKDLEYYRNLSLSLKEDVKALKFRVAFFERNQRGDKQ